MHVMYVVNLDYILLWACCTKRFNVISKLGCSTLSDHVLSYTCALFHMRCIYSTF